MNTHTLEPKDRRGESREWVPVGNVLLADKRVLRPGISEALAEQLKVIESEKGAVILWATAIPHKWELDGNFSTITIEGETEHGLFGVVCCYRQLAPRYTLDPVPESTSAAA